jgi:hypothetical protein
VIIRNSAGPPPAEATGATGPPSVWPAEATGTTGRSRGPTQRGLGRYRPVASVRGPGPGRAVAVVVAG